MFVAFRMAHCLYAILYTCLQNQFQQQFERVLGNATSLRLLHKTTHNLNVVNPHLSDATPERKSAKIRMYFGTN